MSTIAAGTSAGTALVSTGNTDGTLQLQVDGTTPSVTLAANGSIGVGSTPGYGTNGQVLTSSGTGSAPTWTTPSAGAFNFVSSLTATAASSALLNTGLTSTYDVYELVVFGNTSANNALVRLRYEIAGSVVTSATYFYNQGEASENYAAAGNFQYAGSGTPATLIQLGNVGNASSNSFNLTIRIYRPSSTTVTKQIAWSGSTNRVQMTFLHGSAINSATGALTGLELTPDSGTISCTMRLYGIANS
jgi:hypothetical protein